MSKIKQLVKKQVTESLEVKFTAESDKATFFQESPDCINNVALYLNSNGSKIPLGSLFPMYSADHGERCTSKLQLLKGEQYSLEITATKEKALAKIGVFWGE
tara:strand:+ start:398 stop:703 length:306 start_codon:yes stop_codon:yes gene_type:complete